MTKFLENKLLFPVGADDERYFDLLNKYEKYIGGVYISWPGAPSGRNIKTVTKSFFDRVFQWCQEKRKVFDIVFNMQANVYYSEFNVNKVNLNKYRNDTTELTFASVILSEEKPFLGFKKNISVNYKTNFIQQIHVLAKEIPGLNSIVIDRDLNRDNKTIRKISKEAKKRGVNADILITEGCLPFCPHKIDHNILATTEHFYPEAEGAMQKRSKEICFRFYTKNYSNILKSPFLTPEALDHYPARFFKISGRELPIDILDKILSYYVLRQPIDIGIAFPVLKFSTGMMTDSLPRNFHRKILHCKNECFKCDFCAKTLKKMRNKIKNQ